MKCDACGGELRPHATQFCGPICKTLFDEGGPEHARREVARIVQTLAMVDVVAEEMVADGMLVVGNKST